MVDKNIESFINSIPYPLYEQAMNKANKVQQQVCSSCPDDISCSEERRGHDMILIKLIETSKVLINEINKKLNARHKLRDKSHIHVEDVIAQSTARLKYVCDMMDSNPEPLLDKLSQSSDLIASMCLVCETTNPTFKILGREEAITMTLLLLASTLSPTD